MRHSACVYELSRWGEGGNNIAGTNHVEYIAPLHCAMYAPSPCFYSIVTTSKLNSPKKGGGKGGGGRRGAE